MTPKREKELNTTKMIKKLTFSETGKLNFKNYIVFSPKKNQYFSHRGDQKSLKYIQI